MSATNPRRRLQTRFLSAVLLLALAGLAPAGVAGEGSGKDELRPGATVTRTPGRQYAAGGLHRLILGGHYRDLWTTPLEVEVLDLATFAGGLTPIKKGGGRQSQTLRLKGADGRQYAFRSVDKDPSAVLSPEYRKTFIAGILRDQVSSQHPVAPVVVAPLLEAAGVLHAQPRLAVLPDDPRLGAFREQFGGMFGMIEERPDDATEETPGFYGASEVVNSATLFKRLEKNPRHRLDSRAFLKARLFDVYIGDWDRHADQWRWARFDEGRLHVWRPIPKDRDQAFARFDGLLNWYAAFYLPTLVTFREGRPAVWRLTFSGRVLDRRLLVDLDRSAWETVAAELQAQLTDDVIDAALRRLPDEYYQRSAPELARALRKRRDGLRAAAGEFYAILAGEVDVHATDEPEVAEVEHKENGQVEVRLYEKPKGGEARGEPYYRRTFDPRETREVRLYLHGGDDRLVLPGSARERILVRVVGGGGDDELVPSAAKVGGGRTRCYDGRSRFIGGSGKTAESRGAPPAREEPIPLVEALPAPPRDWGRTWSPRVGVSFNPDVGLLASGALTYTRYAFRQFPYRQRHSLGAGYATSAKGGRVEYSGDLHAMGRKAHLTVFSRASNIEIIRFGGFGNETPAPGAESRKVRQDQLLLEPALVVPVSGSVELSFGPRFRLSRTEPEADTVLGRARPFGVGTFGQLGAQATVRVDTRNRSVHASRGVLLSLGGSFHPPVLDASGSFGEIHAEGSTYLTARIPGEPTLALRAGGKKVWGRFPFHEAAFVGGKDTVRGFQEQRFAGAGSAYANAELRVFLTRFSFLSPGELGIFALGDAGRVFLQGESSDRWHASVGGGVWLSFVERRNTVSLAVARSAERTAIYARLGFLF